MESNQVEARRAIDIAERKISEGDYVGAKKFVIKAQTLYPNLDGLKQVSMVIDVNISAANKTNGGGGEADWYGVLGVDPLADEEDVKKQYKKLALLLHPDKNKCEGAEGAFKLVLEAWSLLSDKAKRVAYDQNRKPKEAKTGTKKPPDPHKPASCNGNQEDARDGVEPSAKARSSNKPAPVNPSKQSKGGTFWTMCYGCKTQCEYLRDYYLNRAILCPNCGQTFIATEKTPSARFVSPAKFSSSPQQQQQQWSAQDKATNKNTKSKRGQLRTSVSFPTSCSVSARSSYNSGKATSQAQERSKRLLEETLAAAERVRKKLRTDVM